MLDNIESEILKIINFFNKNYNINIENQNNKIKNSSFLIGAVIFIANSHLIPKQLLDYDILLQPSLKNSNTGEREYD